MPDFFEPTTASVSDIPVWLRESWELFTRKPVSFIALALIFFLLAYAARTLGAWGLLFALLLSQIALFVGIVIAEAADFSRKMPLKPTYAMIRNVLWSQLFLAVIYIAIFLASAVVVSLVSSKFHPVGQTHSPLFPFVKWLWSGQVAFVILYVGLTVLSFWFLSPLLALQEIELGAAVKLARRAENMNEWVVFVASYLPMLPFAVLMMLTDLTMVAALPLFPLFAAYQYVSYRHVFLKRRKNNPAVIPAVQATLVPAKAGISRGD